VAMIRFSLDDVPSLAGTTVVVTGANSGIGFVTARELARAGALVTLACRNAESADEARHRILRAVHNAKVTVASLDLESLESIRKCAAMLPDQIDLIVNNAGVALVPEWRSTADGFEMHFGTNYLGHFALVGLLLPRLLEAPHGRVVTVSSIQARLGDERVLLPSTPATYSSTMDYSQSKFANLVFARELQRRASAHRTRLVSVAAHHGIAATDVARTGKGILGRLGPPAMRLLFPSGESGALPVIYAATVASPGSYHGPSQIHEIRGPIGPAKVHPLADNTQFAGKLWDESERLTGVHFDWD